MGTLKLSPTEMVLLDIAQHISNSTGIEPAGFQASTPILFFEDWSRLEYISYGAVVLKKPKIELEKRIKWFKIA